MSRWSDGLAVYLCSLFVRSYNISGRNEVLILLIFNLLLHHPVIKLIWVLKNSKEFKMASFFAMVFKDSVILIYYEFDSFWNEF